MAKVSPSKRIKKEKKVKKEGEGKTEGNKNNEDNHSTRKLEGSASYSCKFDKEWSKKKSLNSARQRRPFCLFLYNLLKEY